MVNLAELRLTLAAWTLSEVSLPPRLLLLLLLLPRFLPMTAVEKNEVVQGVSLWLQLGEVDVAVVARVFVLLHARADLVLLYKSLSR